VGSALALAKVSEQLLRRERPRQEMSPGADHASQVNGNLVVHLRVHAREILSAADTSDLPSRRPKRGEACIAVASSVLDSRTSSSLFS